MSGTDYYQSVIQAVWVNNTRKPFDDPRVRRAMHLVLNKPVLVEVVKEVAPMLVGGFIYPFSEFATPKAKLAKRVGYQSDPTAAIKEARQLLAAAGHGDGMKNVDFLVREVQHLQALGRGHSSHAARNSEDRERICARVQVSVWFDEAQAGKFDLAISAIVSTLIDPSDYFNAWYGKGGPQNYSKWSNNDFQTLLPQIDRELDDAKRKALILQSRSHHGAGSTAAASVVGKDQRWLVQLCQGSQSQGLLRYLRRRPFGYLLAR